MKQYNVGSSVRILSPKTDIADMFSYFAPIVKFYVKDRLHIICKIIQQQMKISRQNSYHINKCENNQMITCLYC